MSNSAVTDQLHTLETECERLRAALAEDPQWQALEQAQAYLAAGKLPDGLTLAEAQALAKHPVIAAYMRVTDEIEQLRGTVPAGAKPAAFRTRVTVKATAASNRAAPRRDDLTAIRRIDRALAANLNELGIYSYATIAGWDRYEVRRVRDALTLGKRIWRENWIEQAALLAMQADTALPTVMAVVAGPEPEPGSAGRESADVAETSGVLDDHAVPEELNSPAIDSEAAQPRLPHLPRPTVKVGRKASRLPAPAARRFAYIRGVSESLAGEMRAGGVSSLADIAAWTRADVKWFQAILGDKARISQDQWIEQATLLSRGVWTRHALRVVGGETRALVDMPPLLVRVAATETAGRGGGEAHVVLETLTTAAVLDTQPPAELPVMVDAVVDEVVDPVDDVIVDLELADLPPVVPATPVQVPPTPLRGLSTAITLGKIKRPPPDLGSRGFSSALQPEPAPVLIADSSQSERQYDDAPAFLLEEYPTIVVEAEAFVAEPHDPAADDDWHDAEALVIRRGAGADPVDAEALTGGAFAANGDGAEIGAYSDPDSIIAADPLDFGDDFRIDFVDDEFGWGDEAEVTIVSRPRAVDPDPPSTGSHVSDTRLRGMKAEAPGFVAKREPPRRDFKDYREGGWSSHDDGMEEATVTIIRAESSETDAASIWPSEIANDTGSANEPAAHKAAESAPKLSSRFLRALTGD